MSPQRQQQHGANHSQQHDFKFDFAVILTSNSKVIPLFTVVCLNTVSGMYMPFQVCMDAHMHACVCVCVWFGGHTWCVCARTCVYVCVWFGGHTW